MEGVSQEITSVSAKSPQLAIFGTADVVGNNRAVFDICGNSYRLVVQFNYAAQVARIRFAGTHAEYDTINAATV